MTLEDFFTLTELKDGLTDPDRVNELINVMQSEKETMVNNFNETTRLWSTVANTISATENKNCLDLFINLNGFSFIDKWLKDAQKLENDPGNDFLEELIIGLLKATETLKIDKERLSCFEIGKTVRDLVDHSNLIIREKAKMLCDYWALILDNMDSKTENNQEPLDRVDPSCKSTDGDRGSDIKSDNLNDEKEINVEMSTLSNNLEQIASSADVDKDDDAADGDDSPKISSNSENDTEAIEVENEKSHFFKLTINNKKSDMELDYGMIDPLDIARQVAIEVEREVDSPEPSCSTSKIGQQSQSQSQNQPVDGSDKEVSSEPKPKPEPKPEPVKDPETLISQISEIAQESESNTKKGFFSGFDLNQEFYSEEVDNPENPVSSTISVVSASRAAAAARLPAAPLQFEGTLGWKGSASTSAFRPMPENTGSKQILNYLDFDLNVADCNEDKTVILPGIKSGEESSVANPRIIPERLNLDLNCIGDDGPLNGWQSPYRASSSSSSSKQPILRNIDLNLNDRPGFSIFGTKIETKKNDYVPKLDFNLGKPLEPSMHYYTNPNPNPSFYGHHNGMFFSMPMYASSSSSSSHHMPMHMPYMVDSRFIPQVIGSTPSPFMMNMGAPSTSAPSGPSGVPVGPLLGPPQHNFDGGLRQFFPQNGNELASSSSSVIRKRNEPDSSWEFFPVNKHQQPPWM